MPGTETITARIRQRRHTRLSMWGLWFLVAIPTLLILTCGILILVYQQSVFEVVMGLSLVIFCGALGAGVTLVVIGIRLDRKLSALQMDFVSKISHELKTPLTSIRMFVETLRLGRVKDPAKADECLDVIAKETDRLSVLISRLLSWGAMEAGAYKIALVEVEPERFIKATLDAFAPQLLAAKGSLTASIPPELPRVQGDVAALTDALMNLLTNAIRYGGEQKKIEVSAKKRGDNEVEISVRDYGIGIEIQHQRRIFDRFYRADERYSRAVGGTGLGLAIAQHIVVAHRGRIEVKSRPGEGSTFTIVLPVAEPEARAEGPASVLKDEVIRS